jgi:hypothetical protein
MNAMLSLSGAALRASNTPEAQAELARRMSKREASGKVTVAALKSWGRTDEANAIVTQAKANKPTKVAKVEAPKPVLTRTTEVVPAKAKAPTLRTRMDGLEQGLAGLASAINAQNLVLGELVRALSK